VVAAVLAGVLLIVLLLPLTGAGVPLSGFPPPNLDVALGAADLTASLVLGLATTAGPPPQLPPLVSPANMPHTLLLTVSLLRAAAVPRIGFLRFTITIAIPIIRIGAL